MARTMWDYMRMAVPSQYDSSLLHLINANGHDARQLSALTPGMVNRVLLFPGAFNPPHQGHLALLNHVLAETMISLNIKGVIIFPHDDDQVQEKLKGKQHSRVFQKGCRALWWRKGGVPADDAWVFDGSRQDLDEILNRLRWRLKRDRFIVEIILLVGPDWMTSAAVYDPGLWKCSSAITCDISRSVDFRSELTLRQIPGCSVWQQHVLAERTRLHARGTPKGAFACFFSVRICLTHDAVSPVKTREGGHPASNRIFWSCQFLRKPIRRFFFLPCSPGGRLSGGAPSSSDIREWLNSGEDVRAQLDSTAALCPFSVVQMDLLMKSNDQRRKV